MVVDADIRLLYVNDAAEELLGWRSADWVGRSLLSLVHPDDIAVVVS